jgi:uncharacterized repeat protein (TIGR03837 family)
MLSQKNPTTSLALFCKVVDNYGDIGICWRLAKQLQREHGIAVTLWVDDLRSFQRICPEVALAEEVQHILGVTVRYWWMHEGDDGEKGEGAEEAAFSVADVADIVIEFFGCDIPPAYIRAMVQCEPRPVWLNLEGLSAEEWVEGCHKLPSSHPRLPLMKYFFFPGFTEKTGGLLHESDLEQQRRQFQTTPMAIADFLARFGVTEAQAASLKISLFCYPDAPVSALFDAWQLGDTMITCLVPEGVAQPAVQAFLGAQAKAGAVATHGALTVRVLPFVAQSDYDKLLWVCDINFVRGEDSFVRAQWAGKPFIWHIYPQDEQLHHKKLRAFLQRQGSRDSMKSVSALSLRWNGVVADTDGGACTQPSLSDLWQQFQFDMADIAFESGHWQSRMLANGDLATNLLAFSRSLPK